MTSRAIHNLSRYTFTAAALLLALTIGVPSTTAQPASRESGTQTDPTAPLTRRDVSGRIVDTTGAPLSGALVQLRRLEGRRTSSLLAEVETDADGRFSAPDLPQGAYRLVVSRGGFSRSTLDVAAEGPDEVLLTLAAAAVSEAVTVRATRLAGVPDELRRLPGSIEVLDAETLTAARVFTVNEALRKISGIHVRDEEGFGLRPNIGIRGLNPTRSTKVLLLEDGVPLGFAPYGDNAAYYHPPMERVESIEVLKGAAQIAYGPSTVGGVINYVTPTPPERFGGMVTLEAGNRSFVNGHGTAGTTIGRVSLLGGYMRRQGDGARDNTSSKLDDMTGKVVVSLTPSQVLTIRGSRYTEDSQITYSGLRLDEYTANPRQNPFANDQFNTVRLGTSATHAFVISSAAVLSTNLYLSSFDRNWWRQSSNSAQRPNDASDPVCGGMGNLLSTCGNEGRLRYYTSVGIEPRLRLSHALFGIRQDTDFGVRVHLEHQDRQQENGDTPVSRSGRLVEDNVRDAEAYSGFIQHRLMLRDLSITPGVRVERVRFSRLNRLGDGGAGLSGETSITQVVPGLGVAYGQGSRYTLFGGVHRGFAPPRVEDIISNTGGVIELDPELSWNYEAGMRTRLHPGVSVDATFFRMDYENQLVPASLAGGVGAVLTNGGQTEHQGLEMSARVDSASLRRTAHNLYARTTYTWLPVARFTGTRFSSIPGAGGVSVSGNRLPYAPTSTLTAAVGYAHTNGLSVMLEAQHLGEQFGDDLNTVEPTNDGQRGLLPAMTLWNATLNYRLTRLPVTLYSTVKNLSDVTAIVDRTRGILPSAPRLVQFGASVAF